MENWRKNSNESLKKINNENLKTKQNNSETK